MIELIFVIVIIGILAAVAIPKLAGVQDQAHASKAGEFVGQLNSIIMPNLYSKAIVKDVTTSTNAITALSPLPKLEDLIEIPKNFTVAATGLTVLGQANARNGGSGTVPSGALLTNTTNNISIWCVDGNSTELPRCWYTATSNPTVTSADFNVTKSSF